MDQISPDADEFELRENCLDLVRSSLFESMQTLTMVESAQINILEDNVEIKSHFVKAHGMLAVMDVLQATRSREILGILLRVVNLVRFSPPE